jgi:hypothetical protein
MSSMQLGGTFVMTHLWIVLTAPSKHAGHFIIANVTTNVARAGTECELNQGDHAFITQKCYVSFADAREVTPKEEVKIVAFLAAGHIKMHYPMAPAVIAKIVAAAKTSKALAVGYRTKYF